MFREDFSSNEATTSEVMAESRNEMNNLVQEINESQENGKPFPNQAKTYWDSWKRTDKIYPNGEIPKTAIREVNGRKYILDIGLTFALTKAGDTRDGICREVNKTAPSGRDFSYLQPGASKYQSINIPAKDLPLNRWIPLPLQAEDRIITHEQFLNYASEAIDEMLNPKSSRDEAYSEEIKNLVAKVGKKELTCHMLGVAKQESGGAPLGQFAFHRWEKHHNDFSHSIFHVMLEGPGSTARQKLGMTPGQMNHPKNSCKLFLAFLVEKQLERRPNSSAANTAEFWANKIDNPESFATYYNGGNWRKTNPNYTKQLTKYTQDARNTYTNPKSAEDYANIAEKKALQLSRKTQSPAERNKIISSELDKALARNKREPDKKFISNISTNEKTQLVKITNKLLKDFSPNNPSFVVGDSLQVTASSEKIYVRVRRGVDTNWWGPKTIPRTSTTPAVKKAPDKPIKKKVVEKKTETKSEFPKEKLSIDDYHKSVEKEIRSTLKGNTFRPGEKYISYNNISRDEINLAVNQTIKYLNQVAPNEPFDPEIHDITVTADDTHIYMRVKRESDDSLVGNGPTKITR